MGAESSNRFTAAGALFAQYARATVAGAPFQATRDALSFIRAWRANPARVGAIMPSGETLAELMTREIGPGDGPVIELGAGTGVFTRALLARGVPEEQLVLIDAGEEFARLLQARFPAARVSTVDATRIGQAALLPPGTAGAIVSGLPLLNMSTRQVMAIVSGAVRYLRPDGAIYQFTYGPRCPVRSRVLQRYGLKATCIGRAWKNVPPAAVYRISRAHRP